MFMKSFYLIFILLLSGCGWLSSFQDERAPSQPKVDSISCQADTDCVLVSANCCSCNSGGKSIAVHKSQKETYDRDLKKYCAASASNICATVYNCEITYKAKCENSKCITLIKEPQPPSGLYNPN